MPTALDHGETGALAEVLEGQPPVLQIRQLGRGEAELLGELQRLGADLGRDLVHRRLDRHARLHADEQHVERVGKDALDGGLAALHQVGDEHVGQIEAEIGAPDRQADLDQRRETDSR